MKTTKAGLQFLAYASIIIGFVNFYWFIIESLVQGGDALNGKIQNGLYFFGMHGTYTEVSKNTWEWSHFHALSVIFTMAMAALSLVYFVGKFLPIVISIRYGKMEKFPLEFKLFAIFGILMNYGFVLVGIIWIAPIQGYIGVYSTIIVTVIAMINTYMLLVRNRMRW